jgi:hypothetical protein
MSVDGVLSELPMPAPLIAARESSSCVSLPTPTAQVAKHGMTPDVHRQSKMGSNLWDIPHLLPTPRTSDTNGPGLHGDGGMDLRTAATRLLPTPRAQNGEPRNMKPWVRPLDQPQNLENAMARLLPTARDWKDTGDLKKTVPNDDSLLPRAIAHHVTGGHTTEQSDGGKASSDDAPPTPPTNAA